MQPGSDGSNDRRFSHGGGRLAYAEYGDESGYPILYHHGSLGTTFMPDEWRERATASRIRLIVPERPGYGASDFVDTERVSGWMPLAAAFLDHLGIRRFGVLGVSGGAPYAYALAHGCPERVSGVWILSGVPYLVDEDVFAAYPEQHKEIYRRYREAPVEVLANEIEAMLSGLDSAIFPERDREYIRIGLAATLKDGCRGAATEMKQQSLDWGFDPLGLTARIALWHSVQDPQIAFRAVEIMTRKMRSAVLRIQSEAYHSASPQTVAELFEDIRDSLVRAAPAGS